MKTLIYFLIFILIQNSMVLFDFNTITEINNWRIVDDVVMGGKSNGNFSLSNDGYALFKGTVSLKNNGGFSMAQHTFESKIVKAFSKVTIRLKGDGKTYQFRLKTSVNDYYSYVLPFKTSGDWETIEIPFNMMYPAFRGKKLDAINYPGEQMEQIAFLIGNKKAEDFKLMIDSIVLN